MIPFIESKQITVVQDDVEYLYGLKMKRSIIREDYEKPDIFLISKWRQYVPHIVAVRYLLRHLRLCDVAIGQFFLNLGVKSNDIHSSNGCENCGKFNPLIFDRH